MSRLDKIQNWPQLAQQSSWKCRALAKQCGVSVRTLELFFSERMGCPPKTWLVERRQQQAIELLNQNFLVKEAAARLGYKHATHFSREFKKHWGFSPAQFNFSKVDPAELRVLV